jgi:flagellar biosynthesis/type III secretory pathway chaperone
MTLYDYIYVDIDKVCSLYSQLTGGVVELREVNSEKAYFEDNKRKYDLKIFKLEAGGTGEDKSASKAVMKPHHSVLTELEEELARRGYLVDLTDISKDRSLRDDSLRRLLKTKLFLKVRGRAVIEDYERMKAIAQVFPDIVKLINKSGEANIKNSPVFLQLQQQAQQLELEIKQKKDRNDRARLEQRLKASKTSAEQMLKSGSIIEMTDQWILDGLKTWIDAFLSGIVNLRIYPSNTPTDEHVFGHMKKDCFQDTDSNSFHFTYGSIPTEDLTMVGIVTSVPSEGADSFTPLIEFAKEPLADHESVERAFRGVFRGFDGIDQMIRTCRFPRVLVQPLTVYRSVEEAVQPATARRLRRRSGGT